MSRYYKRDGTPFSDTMEWAKMFNDLKYKIVKQAKLKCGCRVSTIWLGLDHNWGNGPPLIFETMVFPNEYQERYTTEKEAVAGHEKAIKNHSCENAKHGS